LLETNPRLTVHWVVLSAKGERRQEALGSANAFLAGAMVHDIQVCDFEDRNFPDQRRAIKRYFDTLGATLTPDFVFTHCRQDLHQDHRLVSALTWNTFRNHLILEYEIPKYDGDLGAPNTFVELPRTICESKVRRILEAFPSQQSKYWFSDETFWALLRLRGIECRSATGYAEGFYGRKLVLS
jgi:LmbE family N-acetylglucosaminyl deacetylase